MVMLPDGLSAVYKTASVVGRLGDNVRALRREIAADADLRAVLALPSARVTVLAHARWASVGRVSVANAHPLNSRAETAAGSARYVVAALNGDIDNHLALRAEAGLELADAEITTDAKLIPALVAGRLRAGQGGPWATGECVASFLGSMAIAVQSDDDPDRLILAVKGGGQGLYVGLSESGYLVASEGFGLVSRSDRYVQVEPAGGAEPGTGALMWVDRVGAGSLAGVRRLRGGAAARLSASGGPVAEVATPDLAPHAHERC